jgi:hypothetical protein
VSKRTIGALVVAFLVVLGAGVLVGRAIGGDDKGSTSTASSSSGDGSSAIGPSTSAPAVTIAPPTTLASTDLDPAAAELAAAINKAFTLTYHATYEGTRTSTTGSTATITVEVWLQAPLARRDTLIVNPKGTVHTDELRLADKIQGCIDSSLGSGSPSWTCVPTNGRGVDPADPILGVARPLKGAVTARDDHVGDTAVRCFSVATPGKAGPEDVCFDHDGIPAAFDGGDGRLERTTLTRGVDPGDIVLPAGAKEGPAPSGGSVTTTTVT